MVATLANKQKEIDLFFYKHKHYINVDILHFSNIRFWFGNNICTIVQINFHLIIFRL